MTIDALNKATPIRGEMSLYDDHMRLIKEEVKESFPDNTRATVLNLVRVTENIDPVTGLPDGTYTGDRNVSDVVSTEFLIQFDTDVSGITEVSMPDGHTLYTETSFEARKVYPCDVTAVTTVIVFDKNQRALNTHYTGFGATYGTWEISGRPDYSDDQLVLLKELASELENADIDFSTARVTTLISNIKAAQLLTDESKYRFGGTDSFNSFITLRASLQDGGKFGMWKAFFDGTNYYIPSYDEFGHN